MRPFYVIRKVSGHDTRRVAHLVRESFEPATPTTEYKKFKDALARLVK